MNLTAKTSNGVSHTAGSPRFFSLLTAHSALFTSSSPLFPGLRSGQRLFQRPSPLKQLFSSPKKILAKRPGKPRFRQMKTAVKSPTSAQSRRAAEHSSFRFPAFQLFRNAPFTPHSPIPRPPVLPIGCFGSLLPKAIFWQPTKARSLALLRNAILAIIETKRLVSLNQAFIHFSDHRTEALPAIPLTSASTSA